jgi:hypothetical protein
MKLPLKHSLKIQVPQSNMDQGCFLDLILKRASFLKEKKEMKKLPMSFENWSAILYSKIIWLKR